MAGLNSIKEPVVSGGASWVAASKDWHCLRLAKACAGKKGSCLSVGLPWAVGRMMQCSEPGMQEHYGSLNGTKSLSIIISNFYNTM